METPTVDETLRILRWLAGKGIEFLADVGPAGGVLSPEDVVAYARDPDAFRAACCDCSVEHLANWRVWKDDHLQCRGITKQGTRCSKMGDLDAQTDPTRFKPGISDRCKIHRLGERD